LASASIGVVVIHGATQFTRTPRFAHSHAKLLVSCTWELHM
jgi:hypothetical protein